MSYFDVTRSNSADLEVAQEKRIYYWDVDENRNLSASWTGFHKICEIERNSFERVLQTRGIWRVDENNSEDITSISCVAWRIDKTVESERAYGETDVPNE